MLTLKVNPVGVDIPIQNAQKQLHRHILRAFEIGEDDAGVQIYGRVYRNQLDRGYVAEVYTGNNEYKEVYWDDSLKLIAFFGISSEVQSGIRNEVRAHIVVFADLAKLALKDKEGNLIQHRADEELRYMFFKALGKYSYGFNYEGFELGIENVLREYSGSRRDDRLKFVDMHPRHCFRLNYILTYDPNKVC